MPLLCKNDEKCVSHKHFRTSTLLCDKVKSLYRRSAGVSSRELRCKYFWLKGKIKFSMIW